MNEDLENPSRTCFVASEIYPRRLNAKEVLIIQRDGEFIFPVADGPAKLSGRNYEFQEPTLRRESTVRRDNLSGEFHVDRKSFTLKKQKMTKESIRIFGLTQNFIHRHHIEPRSSTEGPREDSFLNSKISIFERNSSEKKYTDTGGVIGETPKHLRQKTNSIKLILLVRQQFFKYSLKSGEYEILSSVRDECLGKPGSTNKRSFISSNIDSK